MSDRSTIAALILYAVFTGALCATLEHLLNPPVVDTLGQPGARMPVPTTAVSTIDGVHEI